MATVGVVIMVIGMLVAFVGGIMLLIEAFKESALWGIGCLVGQGIVSLVFLILHWDVAKKPFFIQLIGIGVMILGMVLVAAGADPVTTTVTP